MMNDPDKRLAHARKEWQRLFKEATEGDTWGDIETAAETYEKLDSKILDELEVMGHAISIQNQKVLNKIRTCISLRIEALNTPGQTNAGLPLNEMKKLAQVFEVIFKQNIDQFPISGIDSAIIESKRSSVQKEFRDGVVVTRPVDIVADDDTQHVSEKKNETTSSGDATIHVYVEKIGLKDATTYMDAQVKVSVVDKGGRVIESQTTPKSRQAKATFVVFGNDLYFKTKTNNFENKGYNFFFEFIHYKPKKKKTSTRCYAFMEPEELAQREGQLCCLELYKKPTDFTRKRVSLHTIKRLYCHAKVSFMS